ncbi:MFS transporter [Hafnia alvei]
MNDFQMTPEERKATWGLGTVFSLRMLGMFMVLPVLTTYGMSLAGASETLIGIAIGIYGLTQAVFQIPFGLFSDRIGRKPLIVGGLLIFALGSAIAAMTDSIWGVILGRALQGSGAIAAAVMALLSDLTREQNRTKAMAFIGVSFGVTFAIAMVAGPIITHAVGLSGQGPGRDSQLVKQLEKAGVPVVFVDFRTSPLKNTLPSMRLLGKVLHREQQAENYINFYQDNVRLVTDVTSKIPDNQKPSVFIELKAATSDDCCGTAGNGNMGDFIDLAGGNNIAKGLLPGALGQINLEKVLSANPDVYIASGAKAPDAKDPGIKLGAKVTEQQARDSLNSAMQRTGISTLKAVQDGNSHAIWHSYYNSPYNVLAVQAFAKWIYPEKFASLDPKKTMDSMYQQFLAVDPSGTYWVDAKASNQ